jgi:hypothetical protein
METTPNKAFIFENDTMRIQYRFDGFYCPVKIEIFNKLTSPLYVDWAKSSVILNGSSRSLWKDESEIELVTNGLDLKEGKSTFSTDAISKGTMKRKEQISYIPPNSYIAKTPPTISPFAFYIPKNSIKEYVDFNNRIDNRIRKQYSFKSENSPFNFRLHLVLSTSDTFSNPIYFDNYFWAEGLAEGYVNPLYLNSVKGNQFFIMNMSLFLMGGLVIPLILFESFGGNF